MGMLLNEMWFLKLKKWWNALAKISNNRETEKGKGKASVNLQSPLLKQKRNYWGYYLGIAFIYVQTSILQNSQDIVPWHHGDQHGLSATSYHLACALSENKLRNFSSEKSIRTK